MNREEKKIMGLTVSSHSIVHLYEGVLPPLIPLRMEKFDTDYFHMGIIVTIFSYAFGLGSLPAGYLSDKLGARILITIFLFGAGIFSIFIWPVGSLWSYGLLMGFIGLFCSTYHPASNTLISISIREKGKAFGIHGIAGSLGVSVVPVLSAWIALTMVWQAPHVIFGFLGIGAGLYSLTVPNRLVTLSNIAPANEPEVGSNKTLSINLIVFFLSVTTLGLTYKGIMTFLPAYMGQNVHLSFLNLDTVALGGTITTIALLSGAVGQYMSGRMLDTHRPEKLYLGTIVIGTIFLFLMARTSNILLVVSTILFALFYFATQPVQNYLLSMFFPEHRHGLGYGIHFFLSFGVGSTAAAVSGYLADRLGLESVFYVMGLCFIVSCFLAFYLFIKTGTQRER